MDKEGESGAHSQPTKGAVRKKAGASDEGKGTGRREKAEES